ncbi:CDP-glycerol glycerophosphotransferase family protein [Viridibacillus sp. YIM B01967]|uniref:CDP-glycerol glycerophosphotransferase family protein n=1 Tax=Viridibacillus soli TaxID=2798301 RepID=A0ABS1H853_9BACL|nr:CDP-glycerol glycerophosphotransferase family protein [Viridibacillus soli]MBK3495594.1 CDP-glycerol glycerophosphotransferase family protein [Viridibacillus soli]
MIKTIQNAFNKKDHLQQYHHFYKKLKIVKNTILMESTQGRAFNGHMFYMLKDLVARFPQFTIYVVARDVNAISKSLKKQKLSQITVVEHNSIDYVKLLASCEILINDTSFYPFFNKKEGQTYINTWHGTPLKHLGKDMPNIVDVSNVQRNFYMADYIITSNQYTEDILIDSHNLKGIYPGTMVTAPSPRNSILFDTKVRDRIRKKYKLTNQKVSFYMPTWRGNVGKVKNSNKQILNDLEKISKNLESHESFFVKLHPFQSNIDLSNFDNIHLMPDNIELYEFLTAVDVLITDYSSIMYDFLNTGRSVVLYAYDKAEYYDTRGAYEDIQNYPLPIATTVKQLISLLKETPAANYDSLKEKFCHLDGLEGTAILNDYLFANKEHALVHPRSIHNGKETVAILSGGFWDNGITTALINTLENIDTSKRNYLIFFGRKKLDPQHYFRLRNLPENVLFYPVPGALNGSPLDLAVNKRYLFNEKVTSKWMANIVKELHKIEFKRVFGDLKIDWMVHYPGFERKYAQMISSIDVKSVMYVHTDMFMEYDIKANYSQKVIFNAYKNATAIAIVNETLVDDFVKRLPFTKDKLVVMNNFLGEDRIKDLSNANLISTLGDVQVDYSYNDNTILETSNDDYIQLYNMLKNFKKALKQMSFTSLSENQKNVIYKNYLKETVAQNPELNITVNIDQLDIERLEDVAFEKKAPYLAKNKDLFVQAFEQNFDEFGYTDEYISKGDLKTIMMDSIQDLSPQVIERNLRISKTRLLDDIFNPEKKVFINIGRYDHQKGHLRLLTAFDNMHTKYPNTSLVIIAPHGPLKEETIKMARSLASRDSIYILGRVSNPYALLKYCDAFVLSSIYEGLGLVAFEALAVDTDLITVNLPPTIRDFKGDEAIIVENSEEGIYDGLIDYMKNPHTFRKYDFSKPREQSIREFESLFTSGD